MLFCDEMMKFYKFKSLLCTIPKRFYSINSVRVRFAPSPTGYLHLGGLRTALYNYLFAKLHNGKFILRIEDTDQSRIVDGAIQELQKDLAWAGLEINEGPNVDGGYGPYLQSQRLHIYSQQVETLLNNQTAYYCFCSDRRLNLLKKEAIRSSQIPKYDNKCRYLSSVEVQKKLEQGEPHCIRFKLKSGIEEFDDLIYGKVSYDITLNEGDPVIMKSDNYPTYHFANVVDDHLMKITHVLRGVEWQISTTKHLLMYKAFSWDPPKYGHLPLLLNHDGTKLSKRQGDVKISYYREKGILPLALINFTSHCGGGFAKDLEIGTKPEIYTIPELTRQFNIHNINIHSGKLMPERLLEFNRLEIRRQVQCENNLKKLTKKLRTLIEQKFYSDREIHLDDSYISSIIKWSVSRVTRLEDLVEKEFAFLWVFPINNESKLTVKEILVIKEIKLSLEKEEFKPEIIKKLFKNKANEYKVPFSHLMKILRGILSGLKDGPSVVEMIDILGKDNTIRRLNKFLNCKNNEEFKT